MAPPLVLDIDGTLTTPDDRLDPRVFELLPTWTAPVVLATGKAFPFPVALAHYCGLPIRVIAENGGVVLAGGEVTSAGEPKRVRAAREAFEDRGGEVGFGEVDTLNRWRETELAVSRDAEERLLRAVAHEFDLELIDSGYAYHLKSPAIDKGRGLETVATTLGRDASDFVAVGDSENDVATFERAGRSVAVANADSAARDAADEVLDEGYMDGTAAVLARLQDRR